jgi:hypothetical protein
LHQEPDLDCVAAALLARAYLTTGRFPDGAELLADYLDQVDAGGTNDSPSFRSSLYVANQVLVIRLSRQQFPTAQERWDAELRAGMGLAETVLREALRSKRPVAEVDAFAGAGGPGDGGRREVDEDEGRYRRLLADPRSRARVATLRLPDRNGFTTPVDALLIRTPPDETDRCEMLKVWARGDAAHSPRGDGFAALCVYMSRPDGSGRCIISVKPDLSVSLGDLGMRLEQREHERREETNRGIDMRRYDANSGETLPNRPGYDNPDPWYDGRAHDYTIIDSPRCGTVLSADEIEQMVLHFGQGKVTSLTATATVQGDSQT